jgi:hypothetical protein
MIEGQAALPSDAWSVSFWSKAEAPPEGGTNTGYFMCDAAANPLENLYLRRFGYTDELDQSFVGPNGKIGYAEMGKLDPAILGEGVWNHHLLSISADGAGRWFVNGDLATELVLPGNWNGLLDGNAEGGSGYTGLCIGNRPLGDRTFYGYLDEFQIYQGSAHEGMAEYLYDNPSATLATFDSASYPDPNPLPEGTIPDDATMYRWRFDGDLKASSGPFHGTAVGDATVGTDDGAYPGSGAIYFDGNDDAVSIPKDVAPGGPTTFVLWSKMHPDGGNGYLISDSADVEHFLVRRTNGDAVFHDYIGGKGYFSFDTPEGEPWPADEWLHHAIVVDPEKGFLGHYVNGSLEDIETLQIGTHASFDWHAFTSELYLGNRADLQRDYKGWIDDLQIYNWAVVPDDIVYLYTNPGEALLEEAGPGLEGDLNGDGSVNSGDLDIVRGNWGRTVSGLAEGDANGDGTVNSADLDIIRANWGATAAAAVPEPGFAICAASLLGLGFLRRSPRRRATK